MSVKAMLLHETIIFWVKQWHKTGSVFPMKQNGPKQMVCMPENIAAVTATFQQSPTRSAQKHSHALGMSDRTLRRILHLDFHFHPYRV
jgi:hypothetical protein